MLEKEVWACLTLWIIEQSFRCAIGRDMFQMTLHRTNQLFSAWWLEQIYFFSIIFLSIRVSYIVQKEHLYNAFKMVIWHNHNSFQALQFGNRNFHYGHYLWKEITSVLLDEICIIMRLTFLDYTIKYIQTILIAFWVLNAIEITWIIQYSGMAQCKGYNTYIHSVIRWVKHTEQQFIYVLYMFKKKSLCTL